MAILHRAPTGRAWRSAALAGTAVCLGVALAWLLRLTSPDRAATRPDAPVAQLQKSPAAVAMPVDPRCDARCLVARVIVPTTTQCAAAIEELAGFGVHWLDGDAASPKFDRVTWLHEARGTVTLAGGRAEFRNAAGALTPVAYDCDFDPAALAVLEARARPRAPTAEAVVQTVTR
jgi:hypothetical protein